MNDLPSHLESRLANLRLPSLAPDLERRIEATLAEMHDGRRGDRMLWSAIAGGAMAACVIVGTLLGEPRRFTPMRSPVVHASDPRQPADDLTSLASAGPRWGDELNLNYNRSFP